MSRRLGPRRVAGALARRVPRAPFRYALPTPIVRPLFRLWLSAVAEHPNPRSAVRVLLGAYDDVYMSLDRAAIAYDDGVHVKHRLTRYHDFFVERVQPGERVLDVGCGKGELAFDLAVRAQATVVGVDNDPHHLAFARSRFAHDRVEYVFGDVNEELPAGSFDAVVLSNVLEHVADRVELLSTIAHSATPSRVLLRVPVHARDWTVPLRQEVGLPHFSDPGHHVEYDAELLRSELAAAHFVVTEQLVVWGEIWAVAEPEQE